MAWDTLPVPVSGSSVEWMFSAAARIAYLQRCSLITCLIHIPKTEIILQPTT